MVGFDAVKPAQSVTEIRIHAVRMPPDGEARSQIKRWLGLVPEVRASRIKRFRREEDQWRSLAGDLLVRYVLRGIFGLPIERIVQTRSIYGKPALRGDDLQFNVSHSGAWTVAAFHHEPVGIDIERVGKADMQLAKSMFTRTEYNALQCTPMEKCDRHFYEIWTGKESYIKAVGQGLSLSLNSFHIHVGRSGSVDLEVVSPPEHVPAIRWQMRSFDLDPDYVLTVCAAMESLWPDHVVIEDANKL